MSRRGEVMRSASEGMRRRVWANLWVVLLLVILGFLVIYPIMMLLLGALTDTNPVVEGISLRSKDPGWRLLARRWSRAFGILFAVGAVSGTVLSFELGLLWPGFMGYAGGIIGLPFSMEGFAFFL